MLRMLTKTIKLNYRHFSSGKSDTLRRDPSVSFTICSNFEPMHNIRPKLLSLILATFEPRVFTDIVERSETDNLSR